jgi:hypothetical protein
MEPINYMLDVQNPIEEAMRGYGLGRADIEQRQVMDMRAAAEARAASEFEMRRAEAERQRAQAEAMQTQLAGLRDMAISGTLTTDALNQFALNNASTFGEFQSAFEAMEAPRREADTQFGIQLSTSLLGGKPEVALAMLDERIAAAENAGDAQEAAALRANRKLVEIDPQGQGVATLALLTASGAIDAGVMDAIIKQTGQGGDATEGFRTLELRAEAAGLVKGTPEYNQFMVSGGKPPEGMAIRTTPEGGIEFVQGAGAVTPFREQESKDIVYAARAEGALAALDPVADQLANLGPRLLEYVPLGQGRQFQDPMFQIANNAGLEFLAAILRKDTGAAITAQEIEIYGQTYLPQPGDSPEALAQKKEARSRALRALQAPMRPEAAAAVSGAIGGEEPAAATATPPPSFINNPTVQRLVQENASFGVTAESIWNAMTAKERAEYGG